MKREPLHFTIGEMYHSTSHCHFVWYEKAYYEEVCDFVKSSKNYHFEFADIFIRRLQNDNLSFTIEAGEPFMVLSKITYEPSYGKHMLKILANEKIGWVPVSFNVLYKKLFQKECKIESK